jgi:hypothetical protein
MKFDIDVLKKIQLTSPILVQIPQRQPTVLEDLRR